MAFVGVVGVAIDQVVDVLVGVVDGLVATVGTVIVIGRALVHDVMGCGVEDPNGHGTWRSGSSSTTRRRS